MSLTNLVKTSCVVVIFILLSTNTFAQPAANFSATPLSGCAPLPVNFTDLSTGNPTSWVWTLGNGTISHEQNPSVIYFNPGVYSVKLVIQNASGADSIVRNQYVTVYAKPTVDFTASSTAGCAPMTVSFSDLSIAGSGTLNSWQWDFGDGTFSTLQNPTHTYTSTGNFNISLLVKNIYGCQDVLTRTNYINITNKPVAAFTFGSTANCGAPFTLGFQNQSSGSGTLTYLWSFGDGSISTEQNPSHTYTTTGTFSVKLITTNQNGCSDTMLIRNALTIANNISSFNSPATICENSSFTVNNTSTPAPVNTTWTFGDGTTSTLTNPTKAYTTAGTYQIKMINNYGTCIDSLVKNITVLTQPSADFTGTPLSSCFAPLTVNFTNTSSGATSYLWTFGDGATSTSNQANPSHTYNTQGNYTVSLKTTAANGCSKTNTISQYINIQLPVATIANMPQKGCAPLTNTFVSNVVGGDAITSYFWDFGDGTSSTLPSPTHTFSAGSYNIKLIIVTASGCTDTVIYLGGIKAGTKPNAGFSATPRDVCAQTPVVFSDLTSPVAPSPAAPNQWLWNFGDGAVSTAQNPQHVYVDTGYFPVQLISYNNGCADTMQIDNYIHISPPIAVFTVVSTCSDRLTKTFTDRSIGADTWLWNFGDGTTSTLQNPPPHTYSASGTYSTSLTVTNNASGCSYTKTSSVIANNQRAGINVTDTVICKKNSVTFNATNITPSLFSSYRWNFGDNTFGSNISSTKQYLNAGIYTISLITTNTQNCKDTVIKPLYIKVNGPTVAFGSSTTSTCSSRRINFTDSSRSDGRNPIASWIWNYGDGNIDTLAAGNTSHSYTIGGSFNVRLIAVDITGCPDTLTKSNMISISRPTAGFSTLDTNSCPTKNITFNNMSTGTGLTYRWSFGDNTSSTVQNPVHTYNRNGLFSITLIVFDQSGCSDTLTRANYINITTPIADFSVSDTLSTCPPLITTFTNSSQNYNSLIWNFGDATTTTGSSPSHFYSTSGNYNASLTVTGPGGCTTTKQQLIVVHGPRGTISYNPTSGCAPATVNFIANTIGTNAYIWDFSDGITHSTTDSLQSHSYTIAGSYLPKAILKDTAGCIVPVIGIDTIRIFDATSGFNFNAPAFCDRGSVQFNNTSSANDVITSYSWNFGDGSSSLNQNPSHIYTSPGSYFPQLITGTIHGCSDTLVSSIPVKVVASPQALISQTADGCASLSVTFGASLSVPDTSAIAWAWTFGNGNTSQAASPSIQEYLLAGTYPVKLIATNSTGCKDTTTSNVHVYSIPVINAGIDTIVCKGRGITLNAAGASTYSWFPAEGLSCIDCASPIASPLTPTKYFVKGTSAYGCNGTDSILVNVQMPFTMTVSERDTMCVGGSLRLRANGASSYSWTPAIGLDNPNSATPLATPGNSVTYQVVGKDDRNCFTDTANVPLIVFNNPTVEAGADKTANVGQTIDLVPHVSADVIDARWTPTGSIFRNIFPGVSVKPLETTTFKVQVKNAGGCVATDEVVVRVLCNGDNLFMPNTFSPNGDGMNDLFFPRGNGIYNIKSLKVFSRWGELVFNKSNFSPNDPAEAWDGTFKGRKLNPDVFVYVIEVMCDNNNTLTFKGNIALIK